MSYGNVSVTGSLAAGLAGSVAGIVTIVSKSKSKTGLLIDPMTNLPYTGSHVVITLSIGIVTTIVGTLLVKLTKKKFKYISDEKFFKQISRI